MYSNYTQAQPASTLTSGTAAVGLSSAPIMAGPISQPQGIVIRGVFNVTAGATAGAYSFKIVKGTATGGTQVGPTYAFQSIVSGATSVPYSVVDTSGQFPSPVASEEAAGGQYSLVITAAGSNGTLNDASMEIMVPDPAGSES